MSDFLIRAIEFFKHRKMNTQADYDWVFDQTKEAMPWPSVFDAEPEQPDAA